MKVKKQLVLTSGSLLLGLALVGSGTFAFFSDSEKTNNTISTGTIKLTTDEPTVIDLKNLTPGDSIVRTFELKNKGTLDIEKLTLDTQYEVKNTGKDNAEDFGEHILVEFLNDPNNLDEVVYETTLADLKKMTPEAISEHIFTPIRGEMGLSAGDEDDFVVQISFVDNGEDQNQFQGNSLELEWTFNAEQKMKKKSSKSVS